MAQPETICAHERCDEPVPETRLRRHGKFCSDLCRVRQWQLEKRREQMTKESVAVVNAAMHWWREGAYGVVNDRAQGSGIIEELAALESACTRLAKAQSDQPTGEPEI